MFCITMYQEDFTQFIQSFAGCVRSIIEIIDYYKEMKESYNQNDFGIVLIADGIAKLPTEFAEELRKHDLFDEELCYNKVARMDANEKHVLRKFTKTITTLEKEEVSRVWFSQSS